MRRLEPSDIAPFVQQTMAREPIVDIHTHLYPPAFGTPCGRRADDPMGLMLWGIDELLTYHYLIAEVYRVVPATVLPYEQFWAMSKTAQADHIWKHLFVERAPISEACRGVLTTLHNLGLDTGPRDLNSIRVFFDEQSPDDYIDRVMQISNVSSITMTNPVFDDNERARWMKNPTVGSDRRFKAVLRIDPILRDFPTAAKKLAGWGYAVQAPVDGHTINGHTIDAGTIDEAKRFLCDWIDRQKAIYLAVSLPPDFRYPATVGNAVAQAGQTMLEKVVLPVCAERGLPFAMMIGSKLQVNPGLKDGGDMVGLSDVASVANLCHAFPKNKFLVTMLARENQHELCVAARKFGNLMVFGCWWFLNNPSLIDEIERMRMELLGTSFIPQHSDARILDQLLYKWDHSRAIIGKVLAEKFTDIANTGWAVTEADVEKEVKRFASANFQEFLSRS